MVLIYNLIEALSISKSSDDRIVQPHRTTDWVTEAINVPAGRIAEALLYDSRCLNLEYSQQFPKQWLVHVNNLLTLKKEIRRHALVIFASNLNWFYYINPDWTEVNLLSSLENDDLDRAAIWTGFLFYSSNLQPNLYLRLKPKILHLVKESIIPKTLHNEHIAPIIFAGWCGTNPDTGERYVSNSEMHNAIRDSDKNFRLQILWQIKSEIKKNKNYERIEWIDRALELFRDVWPPRIWLNTPTVSAKICDIAFLSSDRFPQMAEVIPFLKNYTTVRAFSK